MSLKQKICKEIERKVNKSFIASVVADGIELLNSGGPMAQTFNGELEGFIASDDTVFGGASIFAHSGWDPVAYPYSGMTIDAVQNPSCAGEGIGTLIINPNLPAGQSITTADFSFEILDNSAGLGGIVPFCVSDGRLLGPQRTVPNGGLGTNTAPSNHTVTFTFTDTTCPSEDIRFAYTAWGQQGIAGTNCDEINPDIETLVTVTPSKRDAARECFKEWFCFYPEELSDNAGLSIEDLSLEVTREECSVIHAHGSFDPSTNRFVGEQCGFTVREYIQANTWQIIFDTPLPTADYGVVYGTEQEITPAPTSVIAQTVEGTKLTTGFVIQATTHDNGPTGDPLTNIAPISFHVAAKKSIVTDVTLKDNDGNTSGGSVTGCIKMEAWDNDSGLLEAGEFSQLEIKVNGVSTGAPIVHDYTTSYDGNNKSTWYTPWLAAINALPNWSITLDTDASGNQPAQGKPVWKIDYNGPGNEELRLCKGPAGTTSPEELVINAGPSGILTGTALTYGGQDPIPSPVFSEC